MAPHMTIRKAIAFLGVLGLLHAVTGCQPPGLSDLRPVRIATTFPDANSSIRLNNDEPGKHTDVMAWSEGGDKTKAYVELLLMPGDLLSLEFEGASNDYVPTFWYVSRVEDSQPLVFRDDGPVILLAGRPISLDLNHPDAASWLASRGPDDLSTLRSIRLGGDLDVDLTALKRIEHSGVLIECPEKFTFAGEDGRRLADAILATDPTGLIIRDGTGLDRYLPRLKNLTHLVMGWPAERALPSLREAANLQVLYLNLVVAEPHQEPASKPSDAKVDLSRLDLDQLAFLHTLFLYGDGCGTIKDLAALDKLHGLRHLTLADCGYLGSLSSLPHLYDLTGLEILSNDDKRPIAGLEHLTHFQKLVKLSLFCNLSKDSDLAPLAKLKRLRILVLTKETVKERETEVDDLRRALPNCRIYGMCMGSRWIVAILAAGVALGVVLRRRRRYRLATA